jgi:hypothetical protein
MPDRYSLAQPKHEMAISTFRGRSRWTCVCGAQMKGWTDDPQAMMQSYAEHNKTVERRK